MHASSGPGSSGSSPTTVGSPRSAETPPDSRRTPAEKAGRRGWTWISPEVWDAAAETSPAATYFHRRGWSEAIAAHDRRFEARALGFELASGGCVVLPLVVRRGWLRRGLLGRAVSTQPGTYGGPIRAHRALDEADWSELLAALAEAPIGRIDVHGNLLDPLPPQLARGLRTSERTTHRLELAALPENPRSSYSKGCKHALTKAERAGLRCLRAEGSAALAAYYEVYADSLRRWGRAPEKGYSAALFADLLARPGVELWCVSLPSGEVAAGGLFLFSPGVCVWWHGAMRSELAQLGASNALIHALVLEARARGCRWFDFNPSGGHEGVASFKASFGAVPTTFTAWTHLHPLVERLQRRRES